MSVFSLFIYVMTCATVHWSFGMVVDFDFDTTQANFKLFVWLHFCIHEPILLLCRESDTSWNFSCLHVRIDSIGLCFMIPCYFGQFHVLVVHVILQNVLKPRYFYCYCCVCWVLCKIHIVVLNDYMKGTEIYLFQALNSHVCVSHQTCKRINESFIIQLIEF